MNRSTDATVQMSENARSYFKSATSIENLLTFLSAINISPLKVAQNIPKHISGKAFHDSL